MAGSNDSPEEAVDAYVARIQRSLECVANATVFGSGTAVGVEHGVICFSPGQTDPNSARLMTHEGTGEIFLALAHLYAVVRQSDSGRRDSFETTTTYYQYRILDFGEDEVVVYDWDPDGPSPVRSPHLHVPAAGSIILKQRSGSSRGAQRTFLGSLHLPTGFIAIEDIIELLIHEFQVVPRRSDWDAVLAANRATLLK